jgi:AcrR family transcriptional regulator
MATPPKANTLPRARRTQAERSETMRQRILDATLSCLQTDGYAGTTVSRIIEVAGVSRGAPLHHFPSKSALIAAAAEQLIRRVYIQMGKAVAKLQGSEDRLHDLIYSAWKNVFNRPEHIALHELLVASQRDRELAGILQKVWTAGYFTLGNAADHYLEPTREQANVREMMVLTQWLLRGMAEDLHIVADRKLFDRYLKLWCEMLAVHLRARAGVTEPPPRPSQWDQSLSNLT